MAATYELMVRIYFFLSPFFIPLSFRDMYDRSRTWPELDRCGEIREAIKNAARVGFIHVTEGLSFVGSGLRKELEAKLCLQTLVQIDGEE